MRDRPCRPEDTAPAPTRPAPVPPAPALPAPVPPAPTRPVPARPVPAAGPPIPAVPVRILPPATAAGLLPLGTPIPAPTSQPRPPRQNATGSISLRDSKSSETEDLPISTAAGMSISITRSPGQTR